MNTLAKARAAAIFEAKVSGSKYVEFMEKLDAFLAEASKTASESDASKTDASSDLPSADWQMVVEIRGGISNLISPQPPRPGPVGEPSATIKVIKNG